MIRSPGAAALALALALASTGCVSLLPQSKPVALYRFGGGEGVASAREPAMAERTVALAPLVMPREADGDGILTVEGPSTAYIAGARWVAPATVLFREALARRFAEAAPDVRLSARGEVGRADALLNIEVTRFEARYRTASAAPEVRVTLTARLSAASGRTLAVETFDRSKPADENRVSAIVTAYDQATTEALTALARWSEAHTPAGGR